MARIGILTCASCTQELNCASAVCLGDMRKRKGFFERYKEQEVILVGIISCAGCPTAAAPEKILRRVRALAELRVEVVHLSYCMTALCPFVNKYKDVIGAAYPAMQIVEGTHKPLDNSVFRGDVKKLLCSDRKDMTDYILGRQL